MFSSGELHMAGWCTLPQPGRDFVRLPGDEIVTQRKCLQGLFRHTHPEEYRVG